MHADISSERVWREDESLGHAKNEADTLAQRLVRGKDFPESCIGGNRRRH